VLGVPENVCEEVAKGIIDMFGNAAVERIERMSTDSKRRRAAA